MNKWKVKITKLSDDHFEGNHPNGINTGFVKEGIIFDKPKVGEMFHVGFSGFHTSKVTDIIDENTFKTIYSTYKIEYLKEENREFKIDTLKKD